MNHVHDANDSNSKHGELFTIFSQESSTYSIRVTDAANFVYAHIFSINRRAIEGHALCTSSAEIRPKRLILPFDPSLCGI